MEQTTIIQIDLTLKQQEELLSINENRGWDTFIEELKKTTKSKYLRDLCNLYWSAYNFYDGEDEDSGLCYEIRNLAIENILKTFEYWREN